MIQAPVELVLEQTGEVQERTGEVQERIEQVQERNWEVRERNEEVRERTVRVREKTVRVRERTVRVREGTVRVQVPHELGQVLVAVGKDGCGKEWLFVVALYLAGLTQTVELVVFFCWKQAEIVQCWLEPENEFGVKIDRWWEEQLRQQEVSHRDCWDRTYFLKHK